MKTLKNFYKKQNIYSSTSYAERIKVPGVKPLTRKELATITKKYLGVNATKSRLFVDVMLQVFQEAFDTGRPVPIAADILATPYVVSEDVRPHETHNSIMEVIPAHLEYGLYSSTGKIGCYEIPERKYYIRKTSKEVAPSAISKMNTIKYKEKKYESK